MLLALLLVGFVVYFLYTTPRDMLKHVERFGVQGEDECFK